ncbi:MAG: reverse transcriptase family protein, partial [Flavobacterium sp.]
MSRVKQPVHLLCPIKPTRSLPRNKINKRLNKIVISENEKKNKNSMLQNILTFSLFAISQAFFPTVCSTVSQNSVKRPFITLKVQGITSSWLFDTGAATNVMSLQAFRKIKPENRPPKLPAMLNLSTASADALKIVGVYNLSFNLNGQSIISPVYVCSNLNQDAILGMDAIKKFGLIYSPKRERFSFENEKISATTFSDSYFKTSSDSYQPTFSDGYFSDNPSALASLSVIKTVKIPPLTSLSLAVSSLSLDHYRPPPGILGLAHVGHPSLPFLNGGPGIVETNRLGEVTVRVNNCSPAEIELKKDSIIGYFETINPSTVKEINSDLFIHTINQVDPTFLPALNPPEKFTFLKDLNLTVPAEERQAYLDLILKNHDVFSKTKSDLGCARNFEHKIHLKNSQPTYVKQFPVPEAYRSQLELQVKEWLKMGIVQPTNSPYNSPIFVVPKKDGTPRYVLDFRKLNSNSQTDKYSMKTVEECIGDIGRSGSTIFSTLDLSSGFWQLPLEKNSQKFTAFTVHNMGQFEWTRTSQGLHSAPSQYQRLMELTMKGLHNVIVYIDDLLVHNSDHVAHRESLQFLFDRLRKTNLKLNLKKCHFGSTNVTYLGFRLTPEGILPGTDKLAAVKNAAPPTNVHQIRQFLGLANFFRTHIRNFSLISSPLNALTRKDAHW